MKKLFLGLLLVGGATLVNAQEIVVYGPSSMKWIEKKYGETFERETGDTLKFVSIDGLVGRLKLEKSNPKADIVVGLTELTTQMAVNEDLILPYVPKNIDKITDPTLKMTSEYVTPIDYGVLAINYNKEMIANPPKNIDELAKMSKKLMLENPKTSVTGEEAIQWSIALYGDSWKEFWTKLKPAVYSVEKGWSEAFAKFSSGEAPMMLGYATSNLFFTGDDSKKFDSFLISEGSYIYQEGAGIVKRENVKPGTYAFMERVLSDEFQKVMSEKNYMFPVTNIEINEGFKNVPLPEKQKGVKLDKKQIEDLAQNFEKYKNEVIEILKK